MGAGELIPTAISSENKPVNAISQKDSSLRFISFNGKVSTGSVFKNLEAHKVQVSSTQQVYDSIKRLGEAKIDENAGIILGNISYSGENNSVLTLNVTGFKPLSYQERNDERLDGKEGPQVGFLTKLAFSVILLRRPKDLPQGGTYLTRPVIERLKALGSGIGFYHSHPTIDKLGSADKDEIRELVKVTKSGKFHVLARSTGMGFSLYYFGRLPGMKFMNKRLKPAEPIAYYMINDIIKPIPWLIT
jgi:hypothetical protein